MTIARVFPRRTAATPDDALAFVGDPPLGLPKIDAVHVSVSFTWDLPEARRLADQWSMVAPVQIGGPAAGSRGDEFTPGMYVREGYVITSRGCPMRCEHCMAWRREGAKIRELPISDGWNVLDNNLLACSESHIRAVFAMLKRQRRRAEFTGGLEAARLKPWHVELLADLRPAQMFFAYDEPADYEPMVRAGRMLMDAGFRQVSHRLRAYVLIGYPCDTTDAAESRCHAAWAAGFFPQAMYWLDEAGSPAAISDEWRKLQREYSNKYILATKLKAAKVAGKMEDKR